MPDERVSYLIMNRTRGFVNQNRFKSGRAIKRLNRTADRRQEEVKPSKYRIKK